MESLRTKCAFREFNMGGDKKWSGVRDSQGRSFCNISAKT